MTFWTLVRCFTNHVTGNKIRPLFSAMWRNTTETQLFWSLVSSNSVRSRLKMRFLQLQHRTEGGGGGKGTHILYVRYIILLQKGRQAEQITQEERWRVKRPNRQPKTHAHWGWFHRHSGRSFMGQFSIRRMWGVSVRATQHAMTQ